MDDKQDNSLPSPLPNQFLLIDEELWQMAEERAQEILSTIQPNVLSEVNRKDVIDYVQRLIRGYYGAEVFPFGSVPLKTYLPDGDVDLTALSHENVEEDLAQAVCSILESGEDPEYQVQLVKCTVKNIAVDISFNQMAGLYALRFLEQVDQLVGKNHIFKRSIILIKAWCYYESRILGAHHGLLSTYAVETLVLYIINRFHSSVRGPLEVLYRFLDYYGRFDWEHNYVTIDGPKPLSSLPEIVETPECDRGEFLLQKEFLKSYRDMCAFSARASENAVHEFPTKFLNIMDPLRDDNNLGRSVSRANLHRIRFALTFGARRLRGILKLPGENMGAALEKFFTNTLERNGKGLRPDVDIPVPVFGTGKSQEFVLRGDCESYYGGLQYVQLYRNYATPVTAHQSSPSSPSQADILALSMQQNWSMFYQTGTDVYVPGQTLYHPNVSPRSYSLEERAKSRGTGTYIPDMAHNSYWDMRVRVSRPRRFTYTNHYSLHKSPPRNPEVGVHSETADVNGNSKPFELSKEDFPLLPSVHKAMSEVQESADSAQLPEIHSVTDMDGNSRSDMDGISRANMDGISWATMDVNSRPVMDGISRAVMDGNSRSDAHVNSRSFELSNEDFPLLSSTRKTILSESQKSVKLTKQAKNSSSSQLNIDFGDVKNSQSLTEPTLSTKDEKEDSGVSLSQDTVLVVPKVAMLTEEEFLEGNEKMY
ncbi:uncharacterized protein LOC113872458 isoform X2 [Abrus precatorius]|uniref:Uncharacterized protein LOC113872458 isoform X2 n=1 Tax=Abrus precatorius TaxID=3816 RepID=A0A8B8MDD3_ABRPR|nr:uncharacterized protein LOC113872458 isoform X2 [Abrus precatorius]